MHTFASHLNKEREIRFNCLPGNELAFVIEELGIGMGWGRGWIDLSENRERYWALVNAVMTFRVPYNAGNFLAS
jgi:hypothetical protein